LRFFLQEGFSASKIQKILFAEYGVVVSQKSICYYRNWWFNQMKDIWGVRCPAPLGFLKWKERRKKKGLWTEEPAISE